MNLAQQKMHAFMEAAIGNHLVDASILNQAQSMHEQLVNAALAHVDEDLEAVRRPSISNDGTPVNYSLKLDTSGERPAYRMIVEPGGTHRTVPEQIKYTLQLTQTLLKQWGALDQYPVIDAMANIILPRDVSTRLQLVGGIWLGLAVQGKELDFRMYINLRYGNTQQRWHKVEQLVQQFGPDAWPCFLRIKQQTEALAMPIGFCLSIVNGKIRGVRLYITYAHPTIPALKYGFLTEFANAESDLEQFATSFVDKLGDLTPQSVTMGYDFRYQEKQGILPRPVRFKLEISCMSIPGERKFQVEEWVVQQLKERNINVQDFIDFRQNLSQHFEGSDFHYITLGVDAKSEHLTFYTQPVGLVVPKLLTNYG